MTAMSLFSPAGTPSQEELLLKSPGRFVSSHLKYMQRDSQKFVGQNHEMLDPTLPTLRITQKKWNIWITETSLLAMKEVSIQIRFVEKRAVECTDAQWSRMAWHTLDAALVDRWTCRHYCVHAYIFIFLFVILCLCINLFKSIGLIKPKEYAIHMEHYMTDSSFIRNNGLAIDVDAAFSLSRLNHLNAWYSAHCFSILTILQAYFRCQWSNVGLNEWLPQFAHLMQQPY